ncbi:MAG TPA: hypothetical protein VHM30_07565, partial [Gemmatimonadaceae bacterium]|nr:hypothetical protein [Gemmatimonadaceae bacterium]
LVARHLAREIVLPPLTEADVTSYLAADAGTPDDSVAIAGLLHRHTEGNPLFMTAVLQHLVERGFVERDPGGWRLRRPASEISLEVPDSLREMIAAQIERLDAEEQHVLEVGAIAGMSFAPAISAPSADMNADTFDECCDALARRAHILRLTDTQEMPDGTVMQRYAFAHALYREVLYARQSPARRAMLHRRRAERMEELFAGSLDDVTIQLAIHFEKGGDWARAVKYLRRAADVAATRSALEEARDNLQHAFDLASRLPTAERGMAETEILDTLADLYLGTFDSRAADVLALLGERAMQHGLVEAAAKALVDRVYPVAWESRDRALALVDEALSLSARAMDPLARARVQAQAFIRRIWTRGWSADDALECTRALATIRRLGTPQVVAWHAIDCNLLDLFSSRYGAAARNTIEALATLGGGPAESMYLSYAYSAREFIVPWCFILLGEWGAALRELDAGVELAEKNGDPVRAQTLLLYRAWALLHAMDFASVRAICDSLLPTIDENTHAPWRRLCLTLAGAAEAGLGDNERAFDRALTARGEMDSRPALGDWYWRLLLQRTLVDLRLAAGDLTRARAEGASFLAVARATVERTWLGLAWDANARIALAAGDAGHARGLAQRALAAIDGFETPIAAWQAHATAAQVAREHDDLASMTRHRTASRAVVLDLARRLGDRDDLRHTFLASPLVADAVGSLPPETISQPERNPFDNDSRASHP